MKPSSFDLALWALIVASQACLAMRAFRRDGALFGYLALLASFALVGFASLQSSVRAYYVTYCIGSILEDAAAAFLLFAWLNDLRMRARHRRSGWTTPLTGILVAAGLAYAVTPTLSQYTPNLFVITQLIGHATWLWLAIVLAAMPVYCVVTMATPSRTLMFKLTGIMLYVAAHAGYIDSLLSRLPSHEAIKLASDLLYLASLSLWFASLQSASRASRAAATSPRRIHNDPSVLCSE